jgi:hypothetical protein
MLGGKGRGARGTPLGAHPEATQTMPAWPYLLN